MSDLAVESLVEQLNELTEWEAVAIHLPGISKHHIDEIKANNPINVKNQKLDMYHKWLQLNPNCTWGDVVEALVKAGENRIAENIKQAIPAAKSNLISGNTAPLTEIVEESVVNHLKELYKVFLALFDDIEELCEQAVTQQLITLSQLTRGLSRLENIFDISGLKNVKSIAELFELLNRSCTFLDCDLLGMVVKKIPESQGLLRRTETHFENIAKFKETTPIESLQNKLEGFVFKLYSNQNIPFIILKVHKRWGKLAMKLMEQLIDTLFPGIETRWYKVMPGSLCVTFFALVENTEVLVLLGTQSIPFLKLLGGFHLTVDSTSILQGKENPEYTFESGFLEASSTGNTEAVLFLLNTICVNVSYADENGRTALQLAVENNHLEIAIILLSAKANPNHSRHDGNTPLHTACFMGSTQLAVMLIEYGANPVITNNEGDTPFLSSVRSRMIEVVLMIAPKVPKFQIPPALLLACRLGYHNIISYLLQYTDPPSSRIHTYCANGDLALVAEHIVEYSEDVNSTLALGITPLMIASSCGHNEVVECLIQANATIDSTDKDGYSPLAYALTGNKSLVVVECLLQADANTLVGVNLLQLAAANSDLTDILLQYMALQLYNMFSSLVEKIQRDLSNDIPQQKLTVQELKSRLLNDNEFSQIEGIGKVSSCSELFTCLKPHYHFLSWKIISLLSNCLKQEGYFQHVELFETNLPIDQFPQVVSLVPPFSSVSTCSQLTLSLHREWGIQSMSSLRRLTSLLFSSLARLMSHVTVTVTQQEIFVSYRLQKSVNLLGPLKLLSPETLFVLGIKGVLLNSEPVLNADVFEFSFQQSFFNLVISSTLSSQDEVLKLIKFISKLKNISINCKDYSGSTALIHATRQINTDLVKFLLSEGADLSTARSDGFTALLFACGNGFFEIVKAIVLKFPRAVNCPVSSQTIFPLQYASVNGHTRLVEYLLQNGADPNVCSTDGTTALIVACIHCHVDTAKMLLDAGADPNVVSHLGNSAMMNASSLGYSEIVWLLLSYKADYRLTRFIHGVPFDSFAHACLSGNLDTVNVFLDTVHLSDRSLCLGWYVSCLLRNLHLIEYLINSLPQVSFANRELVVSCVKGDLAYIKRHLHCPDDVEFVHGVTVLMVACSCGHTSIVKALLEAGASVNRSDEFGYKAVDYCEKHSPILDILNNKEPTKRTFDHEKMFESFGGDTMNKGDSGLSSITDLSSSELLF